jgi:hypothetical protein
MRWVCTLTLLVFAAASSYAAAPAKPKTSTAKPPAKSKAASAGRTTRGRSGKRARKAPAPSFQVHPDPDRYQEIQKALADRGYFKGEVNGRWGDDSVDALKRFQADQKLDDDGKISALTLTGLGLGPKHDSNSVSRVPPDATQLPAPVSEAVPGSRPPTMPER